MVDNGTRVESLSGPACRPPADESCDWRLQTGCYEGDKCTFILFSAQPFLGHMGCAPAGSTPIGAPCEAPTETGTADDCVAGALCHEGECLAFCDLSDESSCGERQRCAAVSKPAVELCLESCDPVAQDCPPLPDGQPGGCYPADPFPRCMPTNGDGLPPGAACAALNDCAVGAGCLALPAGSRCTPVCDPFADPACNAESGLPLACGCAGCGPDELCGRIDAQSYGVCYPAAELGCACDTEPLCP